MLGADESRLDRAVEERDEGREVTVVVEQTRGLRVQAELVPGEHLEELVEGAIAAGQRDHCFR